MNGGVFGGECPRSRWRAKPYAERLADFDAAELAHDLGLVCPCCLEGWCPWRGEACAPGAASDDEEPPAGEGVPLDE